MRVFLVSLAAGLSFDLREFERSAVSEQRVLARRLVASLQGQGWSYVTNYSVDEALLVAADAASRGFFARPEQDKERFLVDPDRELKCARGYIPPGGEQLDVSPAGEPDQKEVLDVGLPLAGMEDPMVEHLGETTLPASLLTTLSASRDPLHALAASLLRVVATGLGLPADRFDASFARPLLIARYTHYLPNTHSVPNTTLGCGSHFDFGGFTLIRQDSVGGLQVRANEGAEEVNPTTFNDDLRHSYGRWADVAPRPGTFVLQVGEAMHRLTAGQLPAARHRVRATAQDRYSLSFFFDPDPSAVLAPVMPGYAYEPRVAGHKGIQLRRPKFV